MSFDKPLGNYTLLELRRQGACWGAPRAGADGYA